MAFTPGFLEFCQTKQHLTYSKIEAEDIEIRMNSQQPHFQAVVKNLDIDYSMYYFLRAEPRWTQDEGPGKATIEDAEVVIDFDIVQSQETGAAKFEITNMAVDLEAMQVDIGGKTDLMKIVGKAMGSFKNYVKYQGIELFETFVTAEVDKQLNSLMNEYN